MKDCNPPIALRPKWTRYDCFKWCDQHCPIGSTAWMRCMTKCFLLPPSPPPSDPRLPYPPTDPHRPWRMPSF
jgi:hypothetical protein